MSKRRSVRDLVLKILFQIEVGKLPPEEALETTFEELGTSPEDIQVIGATVRGILAEVEQLDPVIEELAEGWRLDRLAKVDKNVLRAALYELKHDPKVPASVVINDAVEIAKKYSTDDSGRFVNGILGSYVRRRGEAAPEAGSVE